MFCRILSEASCFYTFLLKKTLSHVTEAYLCEVSHHSSVDRSHTVAPVLHLIVPGLDGVAPAVLIAGHVQVLATAASCREQEINTLQSS